MDLTAHLDNSLRHSILGGKFFSSDSYELLKNIEDIIAGDKEVRAVDGHIRAIIAPHSAYELTKNIIGPLYSTLVGKNYDEIFILGYSNFSEVTGVEIADFLQWETALGNLARSKRALQLAHDDDLTSHDLFKVDNSHHQMEHTIEVQLPLLKFALGEEIQLIPMLAGKVSPRLASRHIEKYFDENDLLVLSCELSQNYPSDSGKEVDELMIKKILKTDSENTTGSLLQECTNPYGLATLIELARSKGWRAELIKYQNLTDMAKGGHRSAGFVGIVFYE